jgi:hypothetical protein
MKKERYKSSITTRFRAGFFKFQTHNVFRPQRAIIRDQQQKFLEKITWRVIRIARNWLLASSIRLSVRPPVRMEHFGSHGTYFHEI